MTIEEIRKRIPNKLHTGKNKKPEERNAYENIVMLYSGLHAYSKALRNANMDVPQEVQNLLTTTEIIGKILLGRTQDIPGKESNKAMDSLTNGTLEGEMGNLLQKLKSGEGIAVDEQVRRDLTELLLRCGASLEMQNLDIPEEYRENARAINEKIASTKTAAVDNRKPVNRVAQEEAERKEKQQQKAADVWDYEEGETPTARAYIDALRRKIGDPAFLTMDKEKQNKLLMAVLAARMAVNAERNKGGTLDVPLTKEAFMDAYDRVTDSAGINEYLNTFTGNLMQERMMLPGHGGVFMDDLKRDFRVREIGANFAPKYFMPTALEMTEDRIQHIRTQDNDASDDELFDDIAHIIAARMAVNAERNNKGKLNEKVDAYYFRENLAQLKRDDTLKQFIKDNRQTLIALSKQRGHGGAMEDLYRKHLAAMDRIPEDVPQYLMPTVHERVKALQGKIESRAFRTLSVEEQKKVYKELFVARMAGDVVQRSKADTKAHLSPSKYQRAADSLLNNKELDTWLGTVIANGKASEYALKGHAGHLERRFIDAMSSRRKRFEPNIPNRYKSGQYPNTEKSQGTEINADVPKQHDLNIYEGQNEIRAIMADEYIVDQHFDKGALEEDEQMVRYLAAKAMYVSMVLTNSELKENGKEYVEKMQKGDVSEKKIQEIMNTKAFKNMFGKYGVFQMAVVTYKGGADLSLLYENEKRLLETNIINDANEEDVGENEEKVIGNKDKTEENKENGIDLNLV